MIDSAVLWILAALGLFFLALSGLLVGEGVRVARILAAVCFAVDVILAILATTGR